MAASYPSTVRVFTTKQNLVDVVYDAHVNDLQDEVVAVQNVLGPAPNVSTARAATYATVDARLESIESSYSLTSHTHSHGTISTGGHDVTYVRLDSYTAKGVLLAASAAGTPTGVSSPTVNNYVLLADLAQTTNMRWGQLSHSALADLATGDPHPQYFSANDVTAKGDLPVGTGAGSLGILSATVTNGQVLTINTVAPGGMSWQTPSSGVTDHGLLTGLTDDDHPQYVKDSEYTAKGVVLVGTAAGTFQAQTTPGTSGSVFMTRTGNTNGVEWWAMVIPYMHGWTVGGTLAAYSSGADNYINPLIMRVPTGWTARLVEVRHVLRSGSATIAFRVNDVTVGANFTVTNTVGLTSMSNTALSTGDRLRPTVETPGTSDNLSVTAYIELVKT